MKIATWAEVEEFCKRDGWQHIRSADHQFYRKVLGDGTVLETHISFSSNKTMSPGRFMSVLRTQLKVSQEDFWDTLRTGKPAPRPSTPLAEPRRHEGWVIQVLTLQLDLGLSQIEQLTPEQAMQLIYDYWSHSQER